MQHITETPLIKSVVHDNFRFDFYGYWPCKIVQDEEGSLYLETAHMNKVAFIDTETGKRWYSTGSRYAASWEAGVDVMIPMRRPVIEPYTRKIVDVNVIEQDNFVEIIGGAGFAYEHASTPGQVAAAAQVIRTLLEAEKPHDQTEGRRLIEQGRREARQ